MKTLRTFLLTAGIATIMISTMTAQPQPRKEHHEAMLRKVEDLRKVKLLDVLGLQGDQVEKFFGAYNKLQNQVFTAKQSVDNAADEIMKALDRKAAQAELTAKSDALTQKTKELMNAVTARNEGVRPLLSVEQYAKYLVFESRFQEELSRRIMSRARRMHRQGPDEN